jgi:hypothetical protein
MNKLQIILENIKYFFMNTNDFLGKVLSSVTVGFYTLVLLIQAFKSIFVVLVLGWLLSIVIPASMVVVGLIIVVIILVILLSLFTSIPILGPILASLIIGVLALYYISFYIALIFLIIVLLIYGLFSRFAENVFKKYE